MKLFKLLFLSILVAATMSCSDDDDPIEDTASLKISDLSGSWIATSSVHTSNSDASKKYDMISNGGEIRYTMFSDGRVRTWIDFGTFQDEYDALATLNGNLLTITPAESTRKVDKAIVVKNGNTITMTNSNSEFDFSLTGATPVSSTAVTVFVPNK